ncbi:uncharacterized protein [Temnothorax longispinosus]|uniref:uncharacterized protein n=1 Tax=Temnothorax longispinosus TaxID=300112 RepID=UPI003A9965E4
MEGLNRSRGAVKGKFTSFKSYITKTIATYPDTSVPLDEVTQTEIRERISRIREAYSRYNELQTVIDELTDDEQETIGYRERVEEEYFHTISQAESLLTRGMVTKDLNISRPSAAAEEAHSSQTQPVIQPVHVQATNDNGAAHFPPDFARYPNQNIIYKNAGIRLPTIELPKFSGDTAEWLSFRDTFESLISRNESIDPIQKFHYLKASLEGNAAQIIKSLEFTAVNYTVAWNTICDRFNNKRLLTHNHIKSLFSINNMKEESSSQIREIVDTLNKHLRALNALDQATESWDALLIYLISTKLDNVTARAWEKERAGNDVPTLEEFKSFLNSRADLLEALELKDKNMHKSKQAERSKVKSFLVQGQKCIVCKETHKLSNCTKFLEMSPQKRAECVRGAKLCFNCMKPGHYLRDCKAGSCKQCAGKHNTLLHFDKPATVQTSSTKEVKNSSILCSHNQCSSHSVLLATALILVTDSQGKKHNVRAILDPGSQSSLITTRLCQDLRLQISRIHMTIDAINGLSSKIKHKCKVELSTHHNSYKFGIECLVIPEITGQLPAQRINIPEGEIPSNIKLADPSFNIPGKVNILIGADCFWNLLCVGQLTIGQNQLTFQKTKLGWIAVGPLKGIYSNSVRCNLSRSDDIDKQLMKFWEIEEVGHNKILSNEEKECEDHFAKTVYRNQDGRFVVIMPFKEDPRELGESKTTALKRLISLERRLQKDPVLGQRYAAFLEEYERLGHMHIVSEETTPEVSYYLPHHCVIKTDSTTTGVRVVFDASAPTDNGISLNDLQMVGPTLQQDLFSILIRFRIFLYILFADIEKMYRQVLINPKQRALLRILWRLCSKDPIQI